MKQPTKTYLRMEIMALEKATVALRCELELYRKAFELSLFLNKEKTINGTPLEDHCLKAAKKELLNGKTNN